MKKVFLILGTLLLSLSTYAAMNVNKIDPPFWYTGMQNPELQLMVYGEGIGNAAVSVNYPGVSLSSTVKLESNNYLLVYLKLDKDVKPGKFNLTFTEGKKKLVKEYELKARNKKGCEHKGFDAEVGEVVQVLFDAGKVTAVACIGVIAVYLVPADARPLCQWQSGQ